MRNRRTLGALCIRRCITRYYYCVLRRFLQGDDRHANVNSSVTRNMFKKRVRLKLSRR